MTSPLKRVTDILDVRNFKRVKLMKQNVSVLFLKICFFEKFFFFRIKTLSKLFIQSVSVSILKNYFFEKNGIFLLKKDTIQANTRINCTIQQQSNYSIL